MIKYSVVLMLLLSLLFGCTLQELSKQEDESRLMPDGTVLVPIDLTLPDPVEIITRSAANTEEKHIVNAWVLVFSNSSPYRLIDRKEASVDPYDRGITAALNRQTSNVRVVVLANLSASAISTINGYTVSSGTSGTPRATFYELTEQLASLYSNAGSSVDSRSGILPMTSNEVLTTISTSPRNNINATLTRNYARIDVDATSAAGFTISSARLLNGAKSGYRVAPATLPVNYGGTEEYAWLNAQSGGKIVSPIYLYPNNGGTVQSPNPTYLIVKGTKSGYSEGYYKIEIRYGSTSYDINQNTLYKVNISSVDGPGYATEAEAIANHSHNISYSSTPIDNSTNETIMDRGVFLAVSNSEFILHGSGTRNNLNVVNISHNAPHSTSATITVSGAGLSIPSQDGLTGSGSSAAFATLNGSNQTIALKLNMDNSFTNSSTGVVTVKIGTTLTKEITIKRRNQLSYETSTNADYTSTDYFIGQRMDVDVSWVKLGESLYNYNSNFTLHNPGIWLKFESNNTAYERVTKVFFTRNNTLSRVLAMFIQSSFFPDEPANILYFGSGDTLRVGKWIDDNITQSNLAFFQFGSVIGFTCISSQSWSNSRIMFNTVGTQGSPTSYGTYTNIPYYSGSNPSYSTTVNGHAWRTSWTVADIAAIGGTQAQQNSNAWHTGTNVKAGKGDPCRLAGLNGRQVRGMTSAEIDAYDSGWRMATNNEYVDFILAPVSFYNSTSTLSNANAAYWGSLSGTAGAWLPIPGDRNATSGRTTINANSNGFVPAAGRRSATGAVSNIGTTGYYWSSIPASSSNGYYMYFTSSTIYPISSGGYRFGSSVRCVRTNQ